MVQRRVREGVGFAVADRALELTGLLSQLTEIRAFGEMGNSHHGLLSSPVVRRTGRKEWLASENIDLQVGSALSADPEASCRRRRPG
ncbi:hypothetical protein GCM10007298_01900 [Williamsia phyllosphaerae]|uniref:Uncharacterized protein n=1 Tax=Williamsia phyllosphaerae TaxID=885042 RepID=A0ABQ1U4U9_9NOCA|nr:hypothetical protein GCM10007298_01900 [Williamsia phyllosphaerae]